MTSFDSQLKLTPDEVAELTERILDGSGPGAVAVPLVPIASLLELLGPHHVPEALVAEAVESVLRNRERRLSSALRGKAEELERMLFALLARLDARFSSQARYGLPERGPGAGVSGPAASSTGRGASVHFALRAETGELEVRARFEGGSGPLVLFVLIVRAARPAARWARLLGRDRSSPKRVIVVEPHGSSLEDLIGAALAGRGSRAPEDRALAFALETIGAVVARETDRAVDYLHALRFEGAAPARRADGAPRDESER